MTYVTDEVRTLIAARTSCQRAWHPIEAKRGPALYPRCHGFSPLYWDDSCVTAKPFGGAVAPLAFPAHAFRCTPGEPDVPPSGPDRSARKG